MQPDQRITVIFAERDQVFAPADHLCISSLCQEDLVLDHLHHGPAGRQETYRFQLVFPEKLRYAVRVPQQSEIVGIRAVEDIEPHHVVVRYELRAFFPGVLQRAGPFAQGKSQIEKIAAQGDVSLAVVCDP